MMETLRFLSYQQLSKSCKFILKLEFSFILLCSNHFSFVLLSSSSGPEFSTLTLVDLPGVHFANDDPRMNHVTQDLVVEYIEKNTNSIIVIVSEVGDPTGDSAIILVMQKAPDFRSRTI